MPATEPAPVNPVDPIAEHVRRIVDNWPTPSTEQRDRLAALLRPPIPHGERTAA